MEEECIIPELIVTVTTYELLDDRWEATISHSFHAHDQDTLFRLIEIHKSADPYFRASFDGIFYYRGGTVYLKNSEAMVRYP